MATNNDTSDQRYVRISDIQKEPQKMLMPIRGFERMPLVSLEEAVAPLASILPSIEDYAYIAKKRCEPTPTDGLTQDQSASLILYTMEWEPSEECLYFALNKHLRSEDRKELKPWFLYLKLMLTALSKLPSTRLSVYRGVKMDLSELYPVGKTFVWWGFSSCTSNMGVLENDKFLGKTGQRTLFIIESETGKDISSHSYYRSEKEILLIAARQLEVEAHIQPADNLHLIQLRETQCPISLIQSIPNELKAIPPSSALAQAGTTLETSVTKIPPKPVIETRVVEERAIEQPIIKTSVSEQHYIRTPVLERALGDEHIIRTTAVEKPVISAATPSVKPKVREFALPGAFKQLRCDGRICAKCGNCRDWYYTGDTTSWNWIRNRDNWSAADWQQYHHEAFHKCLKRRNGATCYTLLHRFTSILGGFSAKFVHHHLCLCEDNIRN